MGKKIPNFLERGLYTFPQNVALTYLVYLETLVSQPKSKRVFKQLHHLLMINPLVSQ